MRIVDSLFLNSERNSHSMLHICNLVPNLNLVRLFRGSASSDIIVKNLICFFTAVWMHYMDANKTAGEEAWRQLHKNVASNIEQVLAATPHKAPTIRPLAFHHENYPSQTNQTCRTLLEKQGRAHKRCTPMDPHIWPSKSRTTSSNIHTAVMWGYGMLLWRPARGDER